MKIRITESDIVSMVVESVRRVLNERTQGGYETGSVEWIPFEDNEDRMCDLYDKKIIPEGLYYASFDIEATRSCTNYSDSRREIAPYSDYGDVSYSGDYDEAIKLINQVTDPNVKNELMNSLNAALESIEFDDFEEYEPDPDDYYDSRRDDGRLEEGIMEHDKDDIDYGQVGDWHVAQAQKSLSRGREFSSLNDFVETAKRCELPLRSYECYLTHSDIGLLDKMVHVYFYPSYISYDAPDPSVGVTFGGWEIESIDWAYAEDEQCSVNGKLEPLEQGKIEWLDNAIEKLIDDKFDNIVDKLYS
jgi:hypothetical protein